MTENISAFITKLVVYPVIFIIAYGIIAILGERITFRMIDSNQYSLSILIFLTFIASIISFIFTSIFHIVTNYRFKSFRNWFHYSHIAIGYFSGLISVLITLEPILEKESIIAQIGDSAKFSLYIFFLAISNYTLYKTIILDDEFKIIGKLKNKYNSFM